MKRIIILLAFISSSLVWGQQPEEVTNKTVSIEGVSISVPFDLFADSNAFGVVYRGDLIVSQRKNLFTLSVGYGDGIFSFPLFGTSKSIRNFRQVNLLYGREFKLSRTIYVEAHGGAGYFSARRSNNNNMTENTVGFPIQGKIRFHTGPRFSIGLQIGTTINSLGSIYNAGIFIQWNKPKW